MANNSEVTMVHYLPAHVADLWDELDNRPLSKENLAIQEARRKRLEDQELDSAQEQRKSSKD